MKLFLNIAYNKNGNFKTLSIQCQYTNTPPFYNTKPTHFYSNIRIVSTMPTLRLVYLTDQQYAGMTDHAHAGAANNTTAEIPSINQEQTRLPIADATRNASSNKPPVGEEKKMTEESDHEEDNDYLDTLLQEAIDGVNDRRSFGSHAVRHQQVQQEMVLSSIEESENDSLLSERVVDAVHQFQHEMVTSDD